MHVWQTGETITAELLNALERSTDEGYELSRTNESDIDDIYGKVNAVITDAPNPSLKADSVAADAIKSGAVTGAKLASNSVTAGKLAAGAVTEQKLDSKLLARIDSGGATVQKGTVVTTFANLTCGGVPAWGGGQPRSGVFTMTNGASSPLTIKTNTAFITGLKLEPSLTFPVIDLKTGEPYTFETSGSGAALSCTTDLTIPAQSTLNLIIVEE